MSPELQRRLNHIIESAAQELIVQHQQQMSDAFNQLMLEVRNGQEVLRGYHQGRREERERCVRLLRAEQRGIAHGSVAWKRLGATIRRIEGEV